MMTPPTPTQLPVVLSLDEVAASDPQLTGAKAANLARARAAGLPVLPGVVLTTAWSADDRASALAAWRTLSVSGSVPLVVRSSSTGEDGGVSSMAGVFDSVLDIRDEAGFDAAVAAVLGSANGAAAAGLVDAEMAILVQPMLEPAWGGVLFGADPVTGRRDRLVIAAVPTGPAALVSGEVDGWTGVLTRRGRLVELRSQNVAAPSKAALRRLAELAGEVEATFSGPQDIEWAIEADGTLRLLQARPITTLAPRRGPVFGTGPVAESFPDPLATLEQELWLDPLRDGLREALRLTGTSPRRTLERSPLVLAVDGRAAVDLEAIGADDPRSRSFLHRFDPRPPARRLRASWRVGRLRRALPALAEDLVHRVDAELLAVPALDELANAELLSVLRNGRRSLASLSGYEALAGIIIPEASAATVTGASLALLTVAQARSEGFSLVELVERDPVVLALLPPRIGPPPELAEVLGGGAPAPTASSEAAGDELDPAAIAREALRLRIRWLQELTSRAAWELGRRLVGVGVLPTQASVRLLRLDELHDAVVTRSAPADLIERCEPTGRAVPTRFRLDEHGAAFAVPARRRRGAVIDLDAVGAGGGAGQGLVHHGAAGEDIPQGSVLVVTHLDPRLASVIPRLAGLVAETGNPLSHLAILAREHSVPVVVGFAGARERLTPGTVVAVDGDAGTVRPVESAVVPAPDSPDGPNLSTMGATS